jgi:hypothetical protein
MTGLFYVTTDTHEIFVWIDGNGPVQYLGWYMVDVDGSYGETVATNPDTLSGNGTSLLPLETKALLEYDPDRDPLKPGYDPNKRYSVGTMVHATMGPFGHQIEGIWKLAHGDVLMWQVLDLAYLGKELIPGTTKAFNPGDWFYIARLGSPVEAYNGIYRVDPLMEGPVAILITQTDVTDLRDHLDLNDPTIGVPSVYKLTPGAPEGHDTATMWIPETHADQYTTYSESNWKAAPGHMVYYRQNLDPSAPADYSKLYLAAHTTSAAAEDWQQQFGLYWGQNSWKLIADISASAAGLTIGMIIGWIWSRPAQVDDPPIPQGYLKCDGAAYPKVGYEELYAVVGDRYKLPTDFESQFRVPTADNFIIRSGVYSG